MEKRSIIQAVALSLRRGELCARLPFSIIAILALGLYWVHSVGFSAGSTSNARTSSVLQGTLAADEILVEADKSSDVSAQEQPAPKEHVSSILDVSGSEGVDWKKFATGVLPRNGSSLCEIASKLGGDFLRHCTIPTEEDRRDADSYVAQRMASYRGGCHRDALEFHCQEFAARTPGWCDWAKVPDAEPPTKFLNPDICNALLTREPVTDPSGSDGHKLIFFYPSFSHMEMLKRSITALQHPNHVFLIQVDQEGMVNPTFRDVVMEFASTTDNVCVAQYSYVLYLSASQVLIMWPALAWASAIQGWTHFFLMGAQTYPIVSTAMLRKICRAHPSENLFSMSLLHEKGRGLASVEKRRFKEMLPLCVGQTTPRHSVEKPRRLGGWLDENGTTRGPLMRIDWLEAQLGQRWKFAKSPGVEVMGASRALADFLLHDPRAKMVAQFFSYTPIACEHLVPSIAYLYFRETLTDRNACFMDWGAKRGHAENKVLMPVDWPTFAAKNASYLFARKFQIPGSEEMLERVEKELRVDREYWVQ